MGVNGSRPAVPSERRYGHQTLAVTPTRSDSLRPGDRVFFASRKCTVRSTEKSRQGYTVILELPNGSTRNVTRPPGYAWPVLPPPPPQ